MARYDADLQTALELDGAGEESETLVTVVVHEMFVEAAPGRGCLGSSHTSTRVKPCGLVYSRLDAAFTLGFRCKSAI